MVFVTYFIVCWLEIIGALVVFIQPLWDAHTKWLRCPFSVNRGLIHLVNSAEINAARFLAVNFATIDPYCDWRSWANTTVLPAGSVSSARRNCPDGTV